MFDDFKNKLGYRKALRAVRKRTVAAWRESLRDRHVLIVLPTDADESRELWKFVTAIAAAPQQFHVVSTTEGISYCPVQFIGQIRVLGEKDLGWTGLPSKKLAQEIWAHQPDVAIDLHRHANLAAMYLVGASPARFRIGFWSEEAEPFFDVLFNPLSDQHVDSTQMQRYLEQITPPVLPFQ